MFYLVLFVFAVVCIGVVYFVLVQEPKQGGLSSSIGGGTDSFLSGRGMSGGLVRITMILAGLFVVLAIVLNLFRL